MTLTPPASPPPADAPVGAPITPVPVVPRRAQALIALLAVAVITFGAMVLADPARTEAATAPGLAAAVAPTGNTTEVTVGVDGMSFTPDTIEVPAGDRLLITFDNTGDQRHDLVLANGTETGSIAPGDTAVLDAGVIGSSMEGWCSLAGHRAMGMELDIVAVGGAAATADAGTTDDAADNGRRRGPFGRYARHDAGRRL